MSVVPGDKIIQPYGSAVGTSGNEWLIRLPLDESKGPRAQRSRKPLNR